MPRAARIATVEKSHDLLNGAIILFVFLYGFGLWHGVNTGLGARELGMGRRRRPVGALANHRASSVIYSLRCAYPHVRASPLLCRTSPTARRRSSRFLMATMGAALHSRRRWVSVSSDPQWHALFAVVWVRMPRVDCICAVGNQLYSKLAVKHGCVRLCMALIAGHHVLV